MPYRSDDEIAMERAREVWRDFENLHQDPLDGFAYEVAEYLDPEESGLLALIAAAIQGQMEPRD